MEDGVDRAAGRTRSRRSTAATRTGPGRSGGGGVPRPDVVQSTTVARIRTSEATQVGWNRSGKLTSLNAQEEVFPGRERHGRGASWKRAARAGGRSVGPADSTGAGRSRAATRGGSRVCQVARYTRPSERDAARHAPGGRWHRRARAPRGRAHRRSSRVRALLSVANRDGIWPTSPASSWRSASRSTPPTGRASTSPRTASRSLRQRS